MTSSMACASVGSIARASGPKPMTMMPSPSGYSPWKKLSGQSFSPKAMRKWGFDYAALRAIKPDLVMVSTCLFGQSGPLARMAGYGTMGAALGSIIDAIS